MRGSLLSIPPILLILFGNECGFVLLARHSAMAATQHEYYIRQPSDTEARGPFTFAQLSSLVDTGGIDSRTLFFDALSEQWIPVAGSDELGILLSSKTSSPITSAPPKSGAASPAINLTRAILCGSAVVLLLSVITSMRASNNIHVIVMPFAWIAAMDLLLVVLSFFSKHIFRWIRLRAALGFGFFTILFYLQNNMPALVCAVVVSICLWLATLATTRRALTGNAIAGLASLLALAYCLLS